MLIREESEDGESSFSDSYSEESESDKLSRSAASDEGLEHDALLHPNDRLGYLYMQHFERSAPYARVPLMDKVNSMISSVKTQKLKMTHVGFGFRSMSWLKGTLD